MAKPLTIITPTTGKDSLYRLIESLEAQSVPHVHLLLWDDKRECDFFYPDPKTFKVKNPMDLEQDGSRSVNSIVVKGGMVQGVAAGSSLRSVGLMIASTPYVTFADDDVWFEEGHLKKMLDLVKGKNWAYCRRKVWTSKGELLGVDNFESVGASDAERKVPYEMVDNSCMIFDRRYGSSGAVLYRETNEYNDDRLFYAFLKKNAGEPSITKEATVNQVCPSKLEGMFRKFCDR